MTTQLDLTNPPADHQLTVKLEAAEKPLDQRVRLVKDLLLFVFALGVVGALLYICAQTVLSPNPAVTADEKKWAMSIITAIAGGLVGYLVKK